MGKNQNKILSGIKKALTALEDSGEISFRVGGDVLIRGCSEILQYDTERIILDVEGRALSIAGEGLTMRSYYQTDIWIGGDIEEIRLGHMEEKV